MPGLPEDLRPLATRPYSERPGNLPLEREEVRTALWMHDGNVSNAAAELKVTSRRLRNFIDGSKYLLAELKEIRDQLVDIAEGVIREDLRDPDLRNGTAKFVLSRLGKSRGWGDGAGKVEIKNEGTMVFQWADGAGFGDTPDDSKTIDGEIVDG